MGIRPQKGQRTLAAYLAICKHDWPTSDERDVSVGNDLDTPTNKATDISGWTI